ncbi:MAG: hypothetical protein COA79_08940 [Planctomycetota bacterium]|nr:MAG: hypothetical protein COA79_08940 [Planctomycetota bacterium]
MILAELQKNFEAFGQDHVFKFWDELNELEKAEFLEVLASIDLKEVERIFKQIQEVKDYSSMSLDVAPVYPLSENVNDDSRAINHGKKLLQEKKVACFVVAGGQGSRLGFEGPKGAFSVGLDSGKSLFALQADQIIEAAEEYDYEIPWYVMTSKVNHIETVNFFQDNDYFGLKKDQVFFFSQEMLPAVDHQGKLILSGKNKLFLSPNGHGGSLLALKKSGALEDMKKRGIEYISYYQVDNILINIFDPKFIGFHVLENADMSFKMVKKRNAEEKVGVVAVNNGKMEVIEYSDLPDAEMHAVGENNNLKFWSGSIAIHMFSLRFIEEITEGEFSLPYHKAEKSIPEINDEGNVVSSDKKNGIKFETFVFDAIGFTSNVFLMEVAREDEFAPVKNKAGEDSPETAKEAFLKKGKIT